MRHDHKGDAVSPLDPLHGCGDLFLNDGVERAQRLIEKYELGPRDQSTGKAGALRFVPSTLRMVCAWPAGAATRHRQALPRQHRQAPPVTGFSNGRSRRLRHPMTVWDSVPLWGPASPNGCPSTPVHLATHPFARCRNRFADEMANCSNRRRHQTVECLEQAALAGPAFTRQCKAFRLCSGKRETSSRMECPSIADAEAFDGKHDRLFCSNRTVFIGNRCPITVGGKQLAIVGLRMRQ